MDRLLGYEGLEVINLEGGTEDAQFYGNSIQMAAFQFNNLSLIGSAQSTVWDSLVPSRKRTCVNLPKSSSVEKLKMDLYCILHQQQQKSSYLSGTSEEDLLFVSGTPMDSFEIGHGSVLLKHLTAAQEEESEASSLTLDKKTKTLNEVYSGSPTHHVSKGSKGKTFSSVADEKDKELAREGVEEAASRDKKCQFKPRVLWSSTSPLISINLRDVIGFEQFMRLTNEEQQHLKKYLPSTDTTKFPDTLKSMFGSPHLLEAFSSFQQLLLEGIFDLSFPGINAEDSRNLKRFALVNLTKSNWVQYYQQLKVDKQEKTKGGKENTRGPTFFGCGSSSPVKRHGGQNQKFSELKDTMKCPKLMQKCGSIKLLDTKPPQPNCTDASLKSHYDKPDTDNDGFCFSPRSLFSFTPDRSSCMLDSLQFSAASSEQDLLFDVPSSMCFPQAELLDRGFGK